MPHSSCVSHSQTLYTTPRASPGMRASPELMENQSTRHSDHRYKYQHGFCTTAREAPWHNKGLAKPSGCLALPPKLLLLFLTALETLGHMVGPKPQRHGHEQTTRPVPTSNIKGLGMLPTSSVGHEKHVHTQPHLCQPNYLSCQAEPISQQLPRSRGHPQPLQEEEERVFLNHSTLAIQ